MALQVRMDRDAREPRNASLCSWQHHDDSRRTATHLSEDSAATEQAGCQGLRGLIDAGEGGSTRGRAWKALWITSTIAAASCGDAIETTRSETETL